MKKNTFLHVTLFAPLGLAAYWLFSLMGIGPTGFALAPSRSQPLVTGLIIFIIGYLIFLFLMYSEELKEFYARFTHKV